MNLDNDAERWRTEPAPWLGRIGRIRLKPNAKPGQAGFYLRLLHGEPFEGSETVNVASHLEQFLDEGTVVHDAIDLPQVAARLEAFHMRSGKLCAAGNVPGSDLVQLIAIIARQAAANKRVAQE